MKVTNGITIFASSMFVPVLVLSILSVGAGQGVFRSPTSHAILLVLVFLTSITAWAVTMRGFVATGSARLLLISGGLLGGALLFVFHGFLTNGSEIAGGFEDARAEWYIRLGMLFVGTFFFLTIGFAERIVKARYRWLWAIIISLFVLALSGVGWWLGEVAPRAGIVVASSAGLWTPLGRFLQIASNLLFVLAAIRYLHGAFLVRSEPALAFATGIVMLAMSELTYSSVQISYDSFFWVAHLWLALGFFAFLWGAEAAQQTPHEIMVPEQANH